MDFDRVASAVDGVPNMSREEGRRVYEHLQSTGARDVLELGTGWGVSSAYMAAAIENVGGRVTTVDHATAIRDRDPQPAELHARVGLDGLVDRVRIDDSSYTWWLKDRILERSDDHGNCEPAYDFVYIDGAHNWTIDGLAVFLVEKLLRPGGWLLLDDLDWSYGGVNSSFGAGQGPSDLRLSDAEIEPPHMKLVFDLIVRQHPSFAETRLEHGEWGWAKKDPGAPRRFEVIEANQSTDSSVPALAARVRRKARQIAGR